MLRIFLPGLALLFIGLKLGGVIDWSWWLVMLPILIPFGILFGLVMLAGTIALIAASMEDR